MDMKRSSMFVVKSLQMLVILTLLFAPSLVFADGDHSAQVCVRNDTGGSAEVHSYNGKDSMCSIPHKIKTASKGETVLIKCHGQGKHRCKIAVVDGPGCQNFDDNSTARFYAVASTSRYGGYDFYLEELPGVKCN